MRCLYCGKELALLKRWTGGGEFCSDAHRQQYQEEYNQLALNRLLQAKPQGDSKKSDAKPTNAKPSDAKPADAKPADAKPTNAKPIDAKPPDAKPPEPKVKPAVAQVEAPPPPAAKPVEQPVAAAPEPDPEPEPEFEIEDEPVPAEAYGFFIEVPVPVDAPILVAAGDLGGFDQPIPPAFPQRGGAVSEADLVAAGRVVFGPAARVMDYAARIADRQVEEREFTRSLPAFQFDAQFGLASAGETGLLQTSEESMDILIFPHPPQGSPPLWQENATPFAFGYELGSLARATFRTTGLEDKDEALYPMPAEPAPEQIIEPIRTAPPPVPPRPAPAPPPQVNAPARAIPVKVMSRPVAKPSFVPELAAPAAAAQTSVEPKPEAVPGVITRPLPLILHGLTAGRGKPVQVFQTAVAPDLDIQAPRSSALPLRPVMVFGPAPASSRTEERKPSERMVLVKPDPRKSPQPRPDTRFANGKTRKPDARPEPDVKDSKPAAAAPAPAVKEPPAEPPVESKKAAAAAAVTPVEPRTEPTPAPSKFPEPLARPYESPDLGLPKLNFESGGFWSKLPPAARIGIAAAVVLAVVGIAVIALRSGGSTVGANGPQVVAGSPLPAMESGWITDWGAEPGVRREREISVLRSSLNLSDYRMEFQAQMEGKAIGWVFRAKDGKNYNVAKLEVVTPGLEPNVAIVHFSVVNGRPQARTQNPLPMKVRIDTLYKIRFDAVGDHFSTYVQDEKVDDWTDDRLKTGGVGLYSDRGETMPRPRAVSVLPLVIKR